MLISSLLALSLGAADAPVLRTTACASVEIHQFATSRCVIEVENLTDGVVRIAKISSRSENDVIRLPEDRVIAPHGTWTFEPEIHWENGLGQQRHRFAIVLDDGRQKLVDAFAFVHSVLDEPKQVVDFGTVQAGATDSQKTIAVTSREDQSLRLNEVLEAPRFVDAVIDSSRQNVLVKPSANAPWGVQYGFLKLATNLAEQPEVWIEVKADVHGTVVPAMSPFDMSVMRTGQKHEFLIRLDHRDRKKFKIGSLKVEGINATAELDNCAKGENGCRMVRLTVSDDQPLGALKGKLLVELPEYKQTLPVMLWGLLLSPDTKIQTLDQRPASDATASGGHSKVEAQSDIKSALHKATQPPAVATNPPGRGPLLKWSVASELGVYGYAIYRAVSEDGSQKRINSSAVPAMSEEGSGASYAWRDTTAEPGKTYWYRIGVLFNDGRKQDLTGLQKVVAK